MAANLDGVTIPDDLIWTDEFQTTQIAQTVGRSLTGAFIVQSGTKLHGREMTLSGGGDSGWLTKAGIDALRVLLESNPDTDMTLVYRDETFTVKQNATSGPSLVASPVIDYSTPDDDDWYTLTLKLYITA